MKIDKLELSKKIIKDALVRFKETVDSTECVCFENHRCSKHYNARLANQGLKSFDRLFESKESG